MKLVLCPRCELNYMASTDKYCKVCLSEMKASPVREEVELCSICNENPVIPGRDVCSFCLHDMKGTTEDEDQADGQDVDTSNLSEMESMATMDEILPDVAEEEKLPGDMEHALSLESVREEEEKSEAEADEEDEDE